MRLSHAGTQQSLTVHLSYSYRTSERDRDLASPMPIILAIEKLRQVTDIAQKNQVQTGNEGL